MSETPPVDPVDVVLAQLRAKMDKLQIAIEALEAVRGERIEPIDYSANGRPPTDQAAPPKASWENDPTLFRALSIPDAAIKLLKLADRPMKNPEISSYLRQGGLIMNSADPVNTIGSVLTRRWQQTGDIVKTGRGTWALKEWTKYAQRPRPKNGEQDAPDGGQSQEPVPPPEL